MVNLTDSLIGSVLHISLHYVKFQGQFSLAEDDKKSWDLERPPQLALNFNCSRIFLTAPLCSTGLLPFLQSCLLTDCWRGGLRQLPHHITAACSLHGTLKCCQRMNKTTYLIGCEICTNNEVVTNPV